MKKKSTKPANKTKAAKTAKPKVASSELLASVARIEGVIIAEFRTENGLNIYDLVALADRKILTVDEVRTQLGYLPKVSYNIESDDPTGPEPPDEDSVDHLNTQQNEIYQDIEIVPVYKLKDAKLDSNPPEYLTNVDEEDLYFDSVEEAKAAIKGAKE